MEVERTALPGIGLRHEFRTAKGQHAAVISHYNGRRDLVIYDPRDPDTSVATLTLTGEEASGVAELLGTARLVERLADLQRQVTSLVTVQVQVLEESPYAGRFMGDARVRTRTGASIVAVVRDHEMVVSPGPEFRLRAGDLVVVVGTADGTAAVTDIFIRG
ncbi:MAG: cation:proton antiporter regulatory subunit [Hamadaea sp.]|nr:cation:proton antiporter regulatory subunit [Hamadaea sp.]